jgi:hypothetical protein
MSLDTQCFYAECCYADCKSEHSRKTNCFKNARKCQVILMLKMLMQLSRSGFLRHEAFFLAKLIDSSKGKPKPGNTNGMGMTQYNRPPN